MYHFRIIKPFLKYFLLIIPLQFSQFSPFISSPPCIPQPPASPPQFMSMGCTSMSSMSSLFPKTFLSLPVYFMPTNYASSSLYLFPTIPLPPPHWAPAVWCPFLWFCSCSSCLLRFCFCYFSFLLGSFVDSCEFVVILLFIFFIFNFLDKCL